MRNPYKMTKAEYTYAYRSDLITHKNLCKKYKLPELPEGSRILYRNLLKTKFGVIIEGWYLRPYPRTKEITLQRSQYSSHKALMAMSHFRFCVEAKTLIGALAEFERVRSLLEVRKEASKCL